MVERTVKLQPKRTRHTLYGYYTEARNITIQDLTPSYFHLIPCMFYVWKAGVLPKISGVSQRLVRGESVEP